MRIRTIKPEFWTSEDLVGLADFTLLLAIGLLNYADDEGYFNANPALIRASIFPLRDEYGMIPVAITHLSNRGYLKLYSGEDGRMYGHIVKFTKHQVINKPKRSKIKGLCVNESGFLHLSGINTVSIPSGTGIREQGSGNREEGSLAPEPAASSADDSADLLLDSQADATASKPAEAADNSPILETFACAGPVASWAFRQSFRDELARLFPALDVLREVQIAKAKIDRNAVPKKTARGMPRFLMSWMERSQNSARPSNAQAKPYVGAFR